MKQFAFILFFVVISVFTSTLFAQERGKDNSTPGTTTKLTENPQFQSKVNSRDAQPGRGDGAEKPKTPVVPLTKGEKEHAIRNYRIDFKANPMANPDQLVASMLLFNAQDEQVGLLNFYSPTSKVLTTKETISEKGMVTLSYPIDLMDKVVEFVTRTPQSVIVYNTETKTAYLTMSVIPTRSR
ncbi:MAG: hypothetical protein IPM47_19860 [Sphingobacteriales bacterium]|nr:MAG: hypothetical protein IPM47_19860 [Sphingobacteriales bacterium]